MINGVVVDPHNLQQINNLNNVYINWIFEQLVTAPQMNLCTQDIYNKIGALTDNTLPCIITGGTVTITGGDINISDGFFRCQNLNESYLGATNVQGFFNAPATILPLTDTYYIVAQITISPNTPTQYTYTLTGIYSLIPDLTLTNYNPDTMIILGYIDGTIIVFNNRDYDYGNVISTLAQQRPSDINTNYTIVPTDNVVGVGTAGITISMPLFSSLIQPKTFTIQNISNGSITISGNGGTILGQSTYILEAGAQITLLARGGGGLWLITGGSSVIYPDITDVSGNVTITGSGGLHVDNDFSVDGDTNLNAISGSSLACTVFSEAATFEEDVTVDGDTSLNAVSGSSLACPVFSEASTFQKNMTVQATTTGDPVLTLTDTSLSQGIRSYCSGGANDVPVMRPYGSTLQTQNNGIGLGNDNARAYLENTTTLLGAASLLVKDDFPADLNGDGYQKLPSGLIIQWQFESATHNTTTSYNFPIPFPNACFVVNGSLGSAIVTNQTYAVGCDPTSATAFNATVITDIGPGTIGCTFISIGY